jgi:DNA-binding NtrC family response regulator
LKKPLVLIVEDDEAFNYAMSRAFSLAGAEVRSAHSAEAGRELLAEELDVLVVDILLSDGSGRDLLRESVQRVPRAIRIAISGSEEALHEVSSVEAHVSFRKPLDLAELADAIVGSLTAAAAQR